MRNELGILLERLRGKMSLRIAADKSGLSHTYIRDLELGKNRSTKAPIHPTPETLKKLSEAYDCSYEELMKISGYMDRESTSIPKEQAINIAFEGYSRLPLDKQKIIDDMIKALSKD